MNIFATFWKNSNDVLNTMNHWLRGHKRKPLGCGFRGGKYFQVGEYCERCGEVFRTMEEDGWMAIDHDAEIGVRYE